MFIIDSSPVLLADCQVLHFVLCCDAFFFFWRRGGIDGHTVRPIGQQYGTSTTPPFGQYECGAYCRDINLSALVLFIMVPNKDTVTTVKCKEVDAVTTGIHIFISK